MMRRLEIAQAVVNRPKLLFLDEPSIGLDPYSRMQVIKQIQDLNENFGTTILVTTHDMKEADDLCDRLGLMVWQDFMFACGEYPETPWFMAQVRDEAEKAVARLRNHPSVVLWCGNNECEWLYCTEHPDRSPGDMTGARIFRDVLPSVVRRMDGTRPWWRSSPFGAGFPNAETSGNHHQWDVWSRWKDYTEYENDNARFVTEFGFQAPPHIRTLEEVTLPEERHPQSRVMEHHNKQVEGTERLIRFVAAHHRLPRDLAEFVDRGQLVQAEALKCAAEHWRRRKYLTAGVLFWQLNDCWPVTSWSVIDSRMRPKAAWYYARRFFAPLLVSFRRRPAAPEVWITSDRDAPFASHERAQQQVDLLLFHRNPVDERVFRQDRRRGSERGLRRHSFPRRAAGPPSDGGWRRRSGRVRKISSAPECAPTTPR
jgi:beta-galactosidase/beta-glucuronidase